MPSCEPYSRKASWTIPAIATLAFTLQPGNSSGQQFGVPIQLPTTSVFGVNTTVSVPDGGAISLGGNSGGVWSSTRRGASFRPFGNRTIGGSQFASNVSMQVKIISLAEMEAELLNRLPRDRSLADYARPAAPELTLRQAIQSEAVQNVSPNPRVEPMTSPAESGSTDRNDAPRRSPRPPVDSQATPDSPARFTTDVVDPNGSKQVQEKADFMSRHIGRKKK